MNRPEQVESFYVITEAFEKIKNLALVGVTEWMVQTIRFPDYNKGHIQVSWYWPESEYKNEE